MPKTSNDDLKLCKNPNDLVGGSFDLILTEIWLGDLQVKIEYGQKCCIEDPKANVLDLSKEPTEIFLRPSMLEELGEHGNELAIGNLRGKVEFMDKGKIGQ